METEYEIEGRLGTTTGGERILRLRGAPTPQARLRGWTRLRGYEFDAPSVDYAFAVGQALLVEPHSPTWDKFLDKRRAEWPSTRREAQAFADLQQGFKPLAEQEVAALYRLHEQRVGEEVLAAIEEDPLARKSLVNDALLRDVVAGATGVHLDTSLTFLGLHVVDIPAAVRGKLTPELWTNRVDALHLGRALAWHRTRLAAEYSDEWMGSFARFCPPRCPARLARRASAGQALAGRVQLSAPGRCWSWSGADSAPRGP